MFRNYWKIAFRYLLKNRIYTLINLSGLSVGITCCALIYLYVNHELGFDTSFQNGDNVYRLIRSFQSANDSGSTPATAGPYGPTLQLQYPDDVVKMTRIFPNNGLISIGDTHIQEEKLYFTDSNFFDFFSFELVKGTAKEVLAQPNYAVMTEEAALKYFGTADPIGRSFSVDDRYQFIVQGIVKKMPRTTLDFEVVVPIAVFRERDWFTNWRSNGFYTYLELNPQTEISSFETKLVSFMDERFGEDFERQQARQDLKLQPLNDVYLNTEHEYDFVPHGSGSLVYSSMGIALFILFIACINFINLSTAKYTNRLGEVGIRKVMGAYRSDLRSQFMIESVMLTVFSVVISVVLLEAFLPLFNEFSGLELSMNYFSLEILSFFLILIMVIGIIAGGYPAFFLSSFQPVKIFRGSHRGRGYNTQLRKALVTVQFVISISLIVGTGVIYQQVNFIQNKELGFDKDRVVVLDLNNREIHQKFEVFKEGLLNNANIKAVTITSGEPGGFHDQFIREIRALDNQPIPFRTVFADHDYLKTFGLQLVAGRDFDDAISTDFTQSIILNEAAVERIGWEIEEAIGKVLVEPILPGWTEERVERKVIGVVADYHALSMRNEIEPLIISTGETQYGVAGIKLAGGDIPSSIDLIRGEWSEVVTKHPIELSFLDERIDRLYEAEVKQNDLFMIFSALAIFVGCLGLYGLVSYSAEQRTREIGIRKVHGASVMNIIYILSKDYSKLIIIAFLVAVPLSYYGMQQWLMDYAYQVSIGWEIFLVAGVFTFVVSWITVSYESYKAANINPVEALRYE